MWDRQVQTHLVERQVQDPKAKEHQAVSEGLQQSGGEAQRRPCQAQQLHGCVCVQTQLWSQPEQGGGGEELLPQRLTTIAQLPTGRQQPLVTIETYMEMEITSTGNTLSILCCYSRIEGLVAPSGDTTNYKNRSPSLTQDRVMETLGWELGNDHQYYRCKGDDDDH